MSTEHKHTARGMAQDRKRIAGKQNYEVNYVARKLGVPPSKVEEAIEAVGNDRNKVEDYIQQRTRRLRKKKK